MVNIGSVITEAFLLLFIVVLVLFIVFVVVAHAVVVDLRALPLKFGQMGSLIYDIELLLGGQWVGGWWTRVIFVSNPTFATLD